MIEKIQDKVSVYLVCNQETGKRAPYYIKWKNHKYKIHRVGLHYTLYRGSTLIHMFAVSSQDHYFLLAFNTKNLVWTLEEVADDRTN